MVINTSILCQVLLGPVVIALEGLVARAGTTPKEEAIGVGRPNKSCSLYGAQLESPPSYTLVR